MAALLLGGLLTGCAEPAWRRNARALGWRISACQTAGPIALTELTPFAWDTVYVFAPYTSRERMTRVMALDFAGLRETVSEGMQQAVFVRQGQVVCYVYGYTSQLGYGLDMGDLDGGYIRIDSLCQPYFSLDRSGEVPYLIYRPDDAKQAAGDLPAACALDWRIIQPNSGASTLWMASRSTPSHSKTMISLSPLRSQGAGR
jgi:hypothetical protein